MYIEVYPDIVFLINFFVDGILILLLKKVNKKNSSKLRIIIGALAGGASAAIVSLFPWMSSILRFTLIYIGGSLLMIIIAFGRLKPLDLIKQWIVLNMITYFVGGFINSIYYHTNLKLLLIDLGNGNIFSVIPAMYVIAIISVIGIVSLLALRILRFYQIHKPLVYQVELFLKNQHIYTKGLMDTGNCLYDPIGRKPVMIIENSLMDELLTPEIREDMELAKKYMEGKCDEIPSEQYDKVFRFSYIPYRSVGKTGILLGIRLDKVMIHTEKESICNERITAAICDNCLTDSKEDYHVILHKELL